ncbi:hypothetical protein V6N13_129356 [Hibiscus sabdariffa]
MIADFAVRSNTPRNPRKHRRLDDDPPDTGDPRGMLPPSPPGQSTFAEPRIPSYKDKLTGSSRLPSEEDEALDEDDIEILEGDVTTSIVDDQPSEVDAFGPWMIVERRQRRGPKKSTVTDINSTSVPQVRSRFSPLFDEGSGFQPSEVVEPRRPLGFVANGKSIAAKPTKVSKPSKSVINVCKPLSVARSLLMSCFANKASSSSTLPYVLPISKPIDRDNHSVITISENDDPNFVRTPKYQEKTDRSLPPGDPPDVQGGHDIDMPLLDRSTISVNKIESSASNSDMSIDVAVVDGTA